MYISYRNGPTLKGNRMPERIPVLKFYIQEIDEEFSVDIEDLAEALKPFMEGFGNG